MAGSGFFEVAFTQRACRAFGDEPVPDEVVARMLEAAIHAPSAENRQPWVFVVVRDVAVRARLAAIARRQWESGARDHAAARVEPGLLEELDRSVAAGFGGAPVIVVVGGDTSTGTPRPALPSSIFPAVQNLLLAAAALGYGSALTTLATYAPDEVRAAVGLPKTVEPMAVVPVGRPDRSLRPPRRAALGSKAHLDRFGTPFGPPSTHTRSCS